MRRICCYARGFLGTTDEADAERRTRADRLCDGRRPIDVDGRLRGDVDERELLLRRLQVRAVLWRGEGLGHPRHLAVLLPEDAVERVGALHLPRSVGCKAERERQVSRAAREEGSV